MAEPGAAATTGQLASETGDDAEFVKTLLPPIGSRGSRRFEPAQNPQEVDKFSKAMDRVMAERAAANESPSDENAPGHIIARREGQMANKHGISKVGQGVVEKFHAARHNTAIMSAMGHPGLEKLVAKEEEEKRKRKARLKDVATVKPERGHGKELTALRSSMNGRGHLRGPDGEPSTPLGALGAQPSSPELPNVYAALGQTGPASRTPSMANVTTQLPPAQPQSMSSQPPQHSQQRTAAPGSGPSGRPGAPKEVMKSPRLSPSRSAPTTLRPLGHSTGGGSSEWDSMPHSKGSIMTRRGPPNPRWRRRTQANNPKAAHSGESNVRATSRVGRILTEFGGHDDWCSVTVMRHSLATILQANIRGWLVRKKWLANPQSVVDGIKASIEAERVQKERRVALKQELERRALTRKQKEKAANVLQTLFPQKSIVGAMVAAVRRGSSGDNVQHGGSAVARAKWTRLNKNLDLATETEDRLELGDSIEGSDSDMSDLGMEDMAMVKMRARTPPWQKAEQSQWEGQWAKLNTKAARGNLDVVWDLSDTAARVQAVQVRRAERAAASTGPKSPGGTSTCTAGGDPQQQQYDPATQPLPASVVNDLLVHRYIDKYTRLGLMDHLPLRTTAEAVMQQQQLLLEQQQQEMLLQQQQMQHMHYHQQGQGTSLAAAAGSVA